MKDHSRKIVRYALFVSLAIATSACGDDDGQADGGDPDGGATDPDAAVDSSPLAAVVEAMGGEGPVRAARNEVIEATGQRRDPGEARRVGQTVLLAEFSSVLTAELAAPQLRLDTENTTQLFPSYADPDPIIYTQTIDGENGFLRGGDFIFAPPPSPDATAPLTSARITTQLRQADLSSPLRLIRRALGDPGVVTEEADEMFDGRLHRVLEIAPAGAPPVRLFIDPETSLPAKAEVVEDHPPVGDSLVEAIYSDYRAVGDLRLPFQLTMQTDGLEILAEQRSNVTVNGASDVDYTVPRDLVQPFDEGFGAFGGRSSQWFIGLEYLGLGVAYYADQGKSPATLEMIVDGVYQVLGANHQSLVIEMDDHLILVDAGLYEERSMNVLTAIEEQFPEKPIQHIVASHFHYDHVGGIRHFAAEGNVTVWVGEPSAEFFREVMERPHTVAPDRLQRSPVVVEVEPVKSVVILGDENRTVEVHRIANSHADDMLIVYLPAERLLFNADLFNPNLFPPDTRAAAPFDDYAGELVGEVIRLGLQVEAIVGAHGPGTSTLDAARVAAGLDPAGR